MEKVALTKKKITLEIKSISIKALVICFQIIEYLMILKIQIA